MLLPHNPISTERLLLIVSISLYNFTSACMFMYSILTYMIIYEA